MDLTRHHKLKAARLKGIIIIIVIIIINSRYSSSANPKDIAT